MTRDLQNSVLIALGANVPGPCGAPLTTLNVAISKLSDAGVVVERVSPVVVTKAFPPSDQPDFVNAVALGYSALEPSAILCGLHEIERALGRVREVPWGPRPIDLDLLAVADVVTAGYWIAARRGDVPGEPDAGFILPHPRLHLRSFVLEPLCAIAPDWRHPALGLSAAAMLARLRKPSD